VSIFVTGGLVAVDIGGKAVPAIDWILGLKLAGGVIGITLAHEMGHFLMCLRYGVDATLPFYIPAPFISPVGTLGALIRIRGPIPHRKALFDIGIAGPLAGFAVCLPVLFLGLVESQIIVTPAHRPGDFMGEPLLFQWMTSLVLGAVPDGHVVSKGQLAYAAWFGLLLTALNLMPVGQLDGGHLTYALLRDRARWVSRAGLGACLVLLWFRPTWLVWTALLFLLGRRPHPPTIWDQAPIGRGRWLLALVAAGVFAVSFTPYPFDLTWADFGAALQELLPSIPRPF
jgi:membrane-associated protease RseP (regulator of RpoE activity)